MPLRTPSFHRTLMSATGAAMLVLVGLMAHSTSNFDALQTSFASRWGTSATARFSNWRAFVASGAGVSDMDRLKKVNDFFNRSISFNNDPVVWNQPDYWATPLETLGTGSGDCEDFVIAKYFTLQMVGVSADKMRLTYVRAQTGTSSSTPSQAHMVLTYYAQPGDEPLILDNLISEIRPASRRPDLTPVFSFNSTNIFAGNTAREIAPAIGSGRLSRWENLLKRAAAEGF